MLTGWQDFWQELYHASLNPGEGASPYSFLSLVQTQSHTINQSGNRNVSFMKRKTSLTRNSLNRLPCGLALLLIPIALGCSALAPQAQATCQMECLTGFNTALGDDALINNTGAYNTAIGFEALYSNTSGNNNVASGDYALFSNTSGTGNAASGSGALYTNTTGSNNTASGTSALFNNTSGTGNTATGVMALFNNTTGGGNTATGDDALLYNTTGINNTANGLGALLENTTGVNNTASGGSALAGNTTGVNNTASGVSALQNNITGNDNTANGVNALYSNTSGKRNTADGIGALEKNTTGSGNIALGNGAGRDLTIGDHNIDIGNQGVDAEANTIRIGKVGVQTNTFVAGISGVTVAGGVAVVIDANGQLGNSTSSARYNEGTNPMDKASEAILALKPVTFRYKHELDPNRVPQFGLIAEEVEKINADLVARDSQGKPYTVRYEAVNAMLLNEFLKARRQIDSQQKQIEALIVGLQKVSAQLELNKAAPQTVVGNQ